MPVQVDPEEFKVASCDTKGHSERMWFRIIPGLARQAEEVISSKRFPYRTVSDLLRHAIRRHIIWLNDLDPVPSIYKCVDAMSEVLRDEETLKEFQTTMDRVSAAVNTHLGNGAEAEARRLVLKIMSIMAEMPDGHWKDKYIEEAKSRFGNLISSGKNMRIMSGGKG